MKMHEMEWTCPGLIKLGGSNGMGFGCGTGSGDASGTCLSGGDPSAIDCAGGIAASDYCETGPSPRSNPGCDTGSSFL